MASVMNTVAPEASTVGLASHVPLEPKRETHATEKKTESSSSDIPGSFPETPAADADKQFSINPLPATDFAVNPVTLQPGEKVPHNLTSQGIHSNVTLDKESYEKSDRIPGLTGLIAPLDLAPTTIGAIIPESSLPIVSGDVLTNSAAPQSSTAVLAGSAPLEYQKAPKVVKDSQLKADEEVGASGMETLAGKKVFEKANVEGELLSKVSEAPPTAEGTSGQGTDKTEHTKSTIDYIAEGASAAGVTLLAAGLAARDAIVHAAHTETAQNAAQQVTQAATQAKDAVVTGTQSAAQQAQEAAINAKDTVVSTTQSAAQQVQEATLNAKDTVVSTTQSGAQQATDTAYSAKDTVVSSTQSGAQQATDAAYSAKDTAVSTTQSAAQQSTNAAVNAKDTVVAGTRSAVDSTYTAATNAAVQLPESVKNVLPASVQAAIPASDTREQTIMKISPEVPIEVQESIAESGQGPEATVNAEAVREKNEVESELLKEVETVKPFDDKSNQAADNVPSEVKESIHEAGRSPEAASSSNAVDIKTAVESELLKEVKPVESIDQQAKTASNVPEEVRESIAEAGKAPEAASNPSAVNNKSAVESELLKEVETTKATDEQPKAETLPTEPAFTSVESKQLVGAKDTLDSVDATPAFRAIPESKAAESAPHTELPTPPAVVPLIATPAPAADVTTEVPTQFPTEVTNGSETPSPKTESPALPKEDNGAAAKSVALPSTPAKAASPGPTTATPSSSKAAESPVTASERKKKNRLSSFFGKFKDKVAHKDKP